MGIPRMARTFPLAREAVVSFRTQPGGASLPGVAGLTQTHSVDVVAFAVILTATFLCAASAVRANWTLVLATFTCVPGTAEATSSRRHTKTVVVTLTLLQTVLSMSAFWTGLTTYCTHPPCRARALSSHMVAHSSVLTRASLLTLLPMFTRRTQIFTECPCVSRRALTFPGHMVTGGSVLALTFLEASVAIGSCFTRGLAAPASVPRGADTGSGDGVTQCVVLALAPLGAVGPPVVTVASARTVRPSPARFTLAGVGGHAVAMNTVFRTVGRADLAILVEARAALGLPPVHGLLSSAICYPINNPVTGAFKPVEDVRAAGVINLIIRMSVGLLHGH